VRVLDLRTLSPRITIGPSVSAEQSVPEEVNDREIAVCVKVMDEMKLLLVPEPGKACEFGSFYVVFLVKIDMREKRRRAHCNRYEKDIPGQDKEHRRGNKNAGDEEVRRVVTLIAAIGGRHEMASGVVCVMKPDVILKEDPPIATSSDMCVDCFDW
jgi:hypothetical protein